MDDIVERLRDHDRHIRGRLIEGLTDLVIDDMVEAADEIHRLRSAIWVYLARDENNPMLPKHCRVKANEIAHEIITGGRQGFARRAELGEGK